MISELVSVPADHVTLGGDLAVPPEARATVLFAHGVDGSRHGPGSRSVVVELTAAGYATLSLDLLSEREEREERDGLGEERDGLGTDRDIGFLGRRVVAGADWLKIQPGIRSRPVILFGAGAAAAAVLEAAAELPDLVLTAVAWGGRPDLASDALNRIRVPVLLVVGDQDPDLLRLTQQAGQRLGVPHAVRVVPGATRLFDEPGALDQAVTMAKEWCDERLRSPGQ